MRKEDAPTKAELWEQVIKLTDMCIDKAWQYGYEAGQRSAFEATAGIIELDDIEEDKE
jgi:hypothetical protein